MGKQGPRMDQNLLREYDMALGSMVGCLSHFIIKKKYDQVSGGGRTIGLDEARTLTDLVVEEASVLVGPAKAEELKKRLLGLNEAHLGKGEKS